jgi:fused signal recognition particle receptor
MDKPGFFQRLSAGLSRVRESWTRRLEEAFGGGRLGEETLQQVEEVLLGADVGVRSTEKLMESARQFLRSTGSDQPADLAAHLERELCRLLASRDEKSRRRDRYSTRPWVMMFVGVNGVGKTTTIGKLAAQERQAGRKVLLVAADTFRAAAAEQLEIWAERSGAELIRHGRGQDPSGVVFDAIHAAKRRDIDLVLVDTAGRLHTKTPLLGEIKKMVQVVGKPLPGAPHEVLLVIDATTGQNALQQARVFKEAVGLTGVVLTKLDGTAKGGVVIAIQEELGLPIEYIGVGEGVDDLSAFEPEAFARALFTDGRS